jgi:mersacidin/lichenicidin family type 2 lantibiotic
MPPVDIIRAWKDEEYRRSLTEEQRAALPAHPAGLVELSDEQLTAVNGGNKPTAFCPTYPHRTCTC